MTTLIHIHYVMVTLREIGKLLNSASHSQSLIITIDVKKPLCSLSYNFTATSTDKICGTFNFLLFVHIHYKPLHNVVLNTLFKSNKCIILTFQAYTSYLLEYVKILKHLR